MSRRGSFVDAPGAPSSVVGLVLQGVTIQHIVPGSASFYARELRKGDTVTHLDGTAVTAATAQHLLKGSDCPGSQLRVRVSRNGGTEAVLVREAAQTVARRARVYEALAAQPKVLALVEPLVQPGQREGELVREAMAASEEALEGAVRARERCSELEGAVEELERTVRAQEGQLEAGRAEVAELRGMLEKLEGGLQGARARCQELEDQVKRLELERDVAEARVVAAGTEQQRLYVFEVERELERMHSEWQQAREQATGHAMLEDQLKDARASLAQRQRSLLSGGQAQDAEALHYRRCNQALEGGRLDELDKGRLREVQLRMFGLEKLSEEELHEADRTPPPSKLCKDGCKCCDAALILGQKLGRFKRAYAWQQLDHAQMAHEVAKTLEALKACLMDLQPSSQAICLKLLSQNGSPP